MGNTLSRTERSIQEGNDVTMTIAHEVKKSVARIGRTIGMNGVIVVQQTSNWPLMDELW
jgi:hypothetical protein